MTYVRESLRMVDLRTGSSVGHRPLAERVGTDPAKRAEIIRTVTKGLVVHAASGRQRIEVTYAFARPAGVEKRVAVSPTV